MLGTQQEGLEILNRNNQWVPITTSPEVIVCNVGDMLQRLTNHKLKSTTHRVVNPIHDGKNVSRYSMPFFIHLNPSFSIKTLTKCIDKKNPNKKSKIEMWYYKNIVEYSPKKTYLKVELTLINDRIVNIGFFNQ